MIEKLNRRYKLLIDVGTPTKPSIIEITDPLTLEFSISRGIFSSLNKGSFKIYNLAESTRNKLFQDGYRIRGDSLIYKPIVLQAGYDQLSTIFKGNLLQSFSFRSKSEIIQQIDALDGIFGQQNSFTSLTLGKGTSYNDAINKISKDFVNLDQGVISSFDNFFKRPLSIFGESVGEIKKFIKGEADLFIDNEKVSILKRNESVASQIQLINSESGLLGTPQRRNTSLEVDMIFEPRLTIGQFVEIKSRVNPAYDGQYKIVGISHSGIISGAVAGDVKTKLQLYIGTELTEGLKIIDGNLWQKK